MSRNFVDFFKCITVSFCARSCLRQNERKTTRNSSRHCIYLRMTVAVQLCETSPNSLLTTILYSPPSSASDSITSILASPDVDENVTFLFLLDLSFVSFRNQVMVSGFGPETFMTNSIFWPWLTVCETFQNSAPFFVPVAAVVEWLRRLSGIMQTWVWNPQSRHPSIRAAGQNCSLAYQKVTIYA